MSDYDLSDLRSLKTYVDSVDLKCTHHQMADVLRSLDKRINHYTRLKSMVEHYLGQDSGLTPSQMIGPFLKSLVAVMGDEVLAEDEAKQAAEKKASG